MFSVLILQDLLDFIALPLSRPIQFGVSLGFSQGNEVAREAVNAVSDSIGYGKIINHWPKISDISPVGKGKVLLSHIPQESTIRQISDAFNPACARSIDPIICSSIQWWEYYIKPSELEKSNIHHIGIPCEDHTAEVNLNILALCMLELVETYKKKHPINFHCKVSRGRGPLMAAIFFRIMNEINAGPEFSEFNNLENIEKHLNTSRSQVSIDERKKKVFNDFFHQILPQIVEQIKNPKSLGFNEKLFYGLLQKSSTKDLLIMSYRHVEKESTADKIGRLIGYYKDINFGPQIHQFLEDIIKTPPDRYKEQPWHAYMTEFRFGNFDELPNNYKPLDTILLTKRKKIKEDFKRVLADFSTDFLEFEAKILEADITESPLPPPVAAAAAAATQDETSSPLAFDSPRQTSGQTPR